MSPKQKAIRKALTGLVLFAGLLISPLAHALGDGKGISGPDLEGVSIPPEADRTFTDSELEGINWKCTQDALKNFVDQLFGTTFEQMKVKPARWSERVLRSEEFVVNPIPQGEGYPLALLAGYRSPASDYGRNTYAYCYSRAIEMAPYPYSVILKVLPPSESFTPECVWSALDRPSKLDQLELQARPQQAGLPRLTWDREETDFQYDEYGRLVSSRWVVKNIRVANAAQAPWQFFNRKTERQTNIVFNPQDITSCLRASLLKGLSSK
jgi:hypothetical protein